MMAQTRGAIRPLTLSQEVLAYIALRYQLVAGMQPQIVVPVLKSAQRVPRSTIGNRMPGNSARARF